jgi:glycosyltransferase involved in cell wall biosynthesis
LEPRGWDLIEIVDRSHRQVARLFREAAFHVNVNSQESLNATVAEAMAAGCIPICYDAYGGLDYLIAGVNAYVVPNRHVFPLIDKVLDLTGRYDAMRDELAEVRRNGIETALAYTEKVTEKALLDCYRQLLG